MTAMAERLAKSREVTVTLPGDLVDAIEQYLATDYKDGRDPSRLGALNAVAYLGERLAAIYAHRHAGKEGR